MPLIIMSGIPCSGKSKRAKELAKWFEDNNKKVHVISENVAVPNAGYTKDEYFTDSRKELKVRADCLSEVIRVLNKKDICILDAGNYIKGYRYQLYCASKEFRTPQCTVYCAIQKDLALEFNAKRLAVEGSALGDVDESYNNSDVAYTTENFEGLCLRYEEPNGNNRWDSPLFITLPNAPIEYDAINAALYDSKPPPPNQATQNPPLSSTNYVYELDKLTQDICGKVISARKIGILGPVKINENLHVNVPSDLNVMQLNRLRRQFINYNKMHTTESQLSNNNKNTNNNNNNNTNNNLDKCAQLFVQFLNSNFNQS